MRIVILIAILLFQTSCAITKAVKRGKGMEGSYHKRVMVTARQKAEKEKRMEDAIREAVVDYDESHQ